MKGRTRHLPAPLLLSIVILLACWFTPAAAVKRGDFKTCSQSAFCKRNRELADRASASATWTSPYAVTSASFARGVLTASVANALFPDISFQLQVKFQQDGVARVIMDEVNGLRQRYNEAASWAVQFNPVMAEEDDEFKVSLEAGRSSVIYAEGKHEMKLQHNPIRLSFLRDGVEHIVVNERGLLNMEHFRLKSIGKETVEEEDPELVLQDGDHPEKLVDLVNEAYPDFLPSSEEGMWEESFGGKTDTKPKGPESLSLDITFPGYEHVYGIPQHASSLSLKQTRGGEGAYSDPYRLYNLDVFEYEPDSEMAIYGSIPFMKAHRTSSTVGIFLVTGSETWIDITKAPTPKSTLSALKKAKATSDVTTTTTTHWVAESGILDLFVFLGPTPQDLFKQYTALTGRIPLPQLFAIAYHQCRWNYQSEEDLLEVQRRFDESDIPLDVLWLDIEYAEDHKYFIWDRRYFPHPEKMQAELEARGRKLVVIVDPHIKRVSDLYIYTEAQELDILSKTLDGKEFEGWCWTGSSAWIDWFHPKSWEWWISQFRFEKFKGSTKNLFVWNDMNEPSIFNGPEITMQKDAVHYGGWEHRDVHNIGGMIYQNVTSQGLMKREDPPKRPFVLTRAFYAGSQRFGAMWTGDNLGTWAHLASTVPMLLTNGIAGMTFSGSDVGGFFGNPEPEMMVRWYQVGAVSPFFRAHGHIDTKRREPYLFDEPYRSHLRDAIRLRYIILPSMYTAFYEASLFGNPILRPQYAVFPADSKGFGIDDQFYLGSSGLLVKPVVQEGVTEAQVYLSDDQPYYHYETHDIYFGPSSGGGTIKAPAPLGSLPAFHQGGSIFSQRDLVRRAAPLAWKDPITLVVALDRTASSAVGSLYLDDGESYSHEQGAYVLRRFVVQEGPVNPGSKRKGLKLTNRALHNPSSSLASYAPDSNPYATQIESVVVRKVVFLGVAARPDCVRLAGSKVGLEFEWKDGAAAVARERGGAGKRASELVILDAQAPITKDWDLIVEYGATSCATTPATNYDSLLLSPLCGNTGFRCENVGHTPSCILPSRVNDGICDPECCDGSDETDGKASCPNRCKEVGVEARKQKDEESRKRRVGASVREGYITHGAKERTKIEGEIEKSEKELVVLREREQAAKDALEALETAEASEIERKKNSVLYENIVEMQSAIKSLRTHRTNLEGHVTDLSGILADLSRDFNPNYQDMAVLGASRAFKDWQVANGLVDESTEESDEDEEARDSPPPPRDDSTSDVPDISDAQLEALENEDPLSMIDSLSMQVGPKTPSVVSIFKIENYVPEAWRPQFDQYRTSLVSLLAKTGIIALPVPQTQSDRPELARARAAHSKLQDDIRALETKTGASKHDLEKDWGLDWEWKKLDGTCIENDLGEYTYILCFFGEATQKSNNNQGRTSLGKFSTWSTTAEKGTEEYYQKHVYDNGQRCWNGPARSAQVDFVCGTSNALISVIEPEKCEYLFTVTTPAICLPVAEEESKKADKDEL